MKWSKALYCDTVGYEHWYILYYFYALAAFLMMGNNIALLTPMHLQHRQNSALIWHNSG